MIPHRVAETFGVCPVMFAPQQNVLSVVTADPDRADVMKELVLVSGAREIKAFVARPAAVKACIARGYGGGRPRVRISRTRSCRQCRRFVQP